MPTSKYIGSLLLVALMLATTIGIGIYRHTCFVTGHEGRSIFMVADAGQEDAASCCAKSLGTCKKPAGDISKPGCCEETSEFYQLDIPQKSEEKFAYHAPLLPILEVVTLSDIDFAVAENATYLPLYNNLPPPGVSQYLAQLQVYRL